MPIIQWLNENQGFVMSMLTLVYVAATIVIVIYNRKSIQEMKNTREAESRPYVFAYLYREPRDGLFTFRIKNYGKSGAKIDSVRITPSIQFIDNADPQNFLANVIMAPAQSLQFLTLKQEQDMGETEYSIDIIYSALYGKQEKFSEKYTITIQYSDQMGYVDSSQSNISPEANALKNIANHLESINSKM